MRILFLCTANRFRSQAAYAMAIKMKLNAESAGLYRGVFDKTIPKSLREALLKMGYEVPEHRRSKRVDGQLVAWADKIIYMNPIHYKQIKKKFGKEVILKCSPLGGYTEPPVRRIPDPMFLKEPEYSKCLQLIESGVKALARLYR